MALRLTPDVKLRAAAGGAFRSPTTGELYYPYSGNPNLSPERSVSFEAGAEWDASRALTFEASLFQNDLRDLIQYDFATSTNLNVGRARFPFPMDRASVADASTLALPFEEVKSLASHPLVR